MLNLDNFRWFYIVTIQSVYDGDSITVEFDFGLNFFAKRQKLRLYGIDAPEVKGEERPEGLVSRDYVREILPKGKRVVIETIKDKKGKYGRWLAIVHVDDIVLNAKLVEEGLAESKDY